MNKNIRIFNHYATSMFEDEGGRHYWFSKYLLKEGFKPTIFCASAFHNKNKKINLGRKKYIIKEKNGIKFVFIDTNIAIGNGFDRLKNMFTFYRNIFPVARDLLKKCESPDIILASSVHPLTLIAGEKIAKKLNIPCICEIRDLWPESIVNYGYLKRNSMITKLLYSGEKWIYKNADALIFTVEGGKQYIKDKKWTNSIPLDKIYYINNGVDLEEFNKNKEKYKINDEILLDKKNKNIIYTGSIRRVNNLNFIVECGKKMQNFDRYKNIKFLIYGDGDERKELINKCEKENIKNVIFKGRVEKKYIPSVLSNSWVNLLHNEETDISNYGTSQNKLFEYLASGKCIIQTMKSNYNICEKYHCGLTLEEQTVSSFLDTIDKLILKEDDLRVLEHNAKKAAIYFDFKNHTKKLIEIIMDLSNR